MGQRLRRRLELAFCNDTERILKVFEIVLLTLKPERNPFDLAIADGMRRSLQFN